jgi:F-type H+-transporting ATPase subunit gamma
MSGQLRTLKNRIRGVENTQKITRAMEMVAASKLKRFQRLRDEAVPYVQALEGVLNRLLGADIPPRHPLLEAQEEKKAVLLVITSDTGLCGSYNHGLISAAQKFLAGYSKEPLLIGVGKTGVHALARAGYAWHRSFTDTKTSKLESVILETTSLMEDLFMEKKADAIHVVYSHFSGKYVYAAKTEKILPFHLKTNGSFDFPGETGSPYIMEPSREALFDRLIPLVFAAKVRMIFMESMVAEQMARMNAMSQATENANELVDTLVLLRNKMRQAAITNELIEIVSGSRALKN